MFSISPILFLYDYFLGQHFIRVFIESHKGDNIISFMTTFWEDLLLALHNKGLITSLFVILTNEENRYKIKIAYQYKNTPLW